MPDFKEGTNIEKSVSEKWVEKINDLLERNKEKPLYNVREISNPQSEELGDNINRTCILFEIPSTSTRMIDDQEISQYAYLLMTHNGFKLLHIPKDNHEDLLKYRDMCIDKDRLEYNYSNLTDGFYYNHNGSYLMMGSLTSEDITGKQADPKSYSYISIPSDDEIRAIRDLNTIKRTPTGDPMIDQLGIPF